MGKFAASSVLDGALDIIRNNATQMVACSQQPTTYTEAHSSYELAAATISSSDMVKADDVSGRKLTIAQKAGNTVDNSGTATHVALIDTVNSVLLYVTTATSQALTQGNTMTFNSWKINIQAPS